MSRISRAFENKKAFIPFITAGDPDLETTKKLVLALEQAGADLIELGIPFSDPVAEGPVIQEADYRALSGGATTDKIFELVEEIRKESDIPLAFMTYANPIYTYGTERFMSECKRVGVDAVIVPDIPFEERNEIKPYSDKYDITLISMIAPTSRERIRMIAKEAQGFIYCVSSLGVTGVRESIGSEVEDMIKLVKGVKDIPCAIGFGVSTPEQAGRLSAISDGVIVGSAIVRIIAEHGRECIPFVKEFASRMKGAML